MRVLSIAVTLPPHPWRLFSVGLSVASVLTFVLQFLFISVISSLRLCFASVLITLVVRPHSRQPLCRCFSRTCPKCPRLSFVPSLPGSIFLICSISCVCLQRAFRVVSLLMLPLCSGCRLLWSPNMCFPLPLVSVVGWFIFPRVAASSRSGVISLARLIISSLLYAQTLSAADSLELVPSISVCFQNLLSSVVYL